MTKYDFTIVYTNLDKIQSLLDKLDMLLSDIQSIAIQEMP